MNWLEKICQAIPPILEGLAAEARKSDSLEEFERNYAGQIKHGIYWHVTDDPNFFIDPQRGPRDRSSMSPSDEPTKGALMITSHLSYWASNYAPHRKYAAMIDMSDVPSKMYRQVNRGMGNEFYVADPSAARVVGVFPIKEALRIDYEHHVAIPGSFEALEEFYNLARATPPGQQMTAEEWIAYEKGLSRGEWDKQWTEEWQEDWEEE